MLQGAAASNKEKSLQSLQALETQVVQLQSRLAYMEEEKGRLVAAAKGKNEQVGISTLLAVWQSTPNTPENSEKAFNVTSAHKIGLAVALTVAKLFQASPALPVSTSAAHASKGRNRTFSSIPTLHAPD